MIDYQHKIVYQIYPRSFNDSNGDGIGDIKGIIEKLDVIKTLGVDILWLSPVYRSPNMDNGYDVSDYLSINPEYGTMEDMDDLIKACQEKGLDIIMDLVINHTSDQHEWFIKSKENDPKYRDYYIWREKPNNWSGFFSGTTWEKVDNAYYLHLFLKEQPDLNWHNPSVMEEVKAIMRFWLDKGIAGFRCDVINIIYKTSLDDGKKRIALTGREHYHSQEGCHKILKELKEQVLEPYGAFTVGETVMVTIDEANDLIHPDRKELDMVFSFEHMEVDQVNNKWFKTKFRPQKLFQTLTKWQVGAYWNANYLENHDQPRSVSRFGNDERYHEKSTTALLAMLLTLKGTPFIYQGQEIGMKNGIFNTMEEHRDLETFRIEALMRKLKFPKWLRHRLIEKTSRDHARMPIPWNRQGGFSDATPWIKMNNRMSDINIEDQMNDPTSLWHQTKKLIAIRKQNAALTEGDFEPIWIGKHVFVYQRRCEKQTISVAINLSKRTVKLKPSVKGKIIWTNDGQHKSDYLSPYEAIIIES